MRCRACETICSATSRGRAGGGNTNRASANAKAAPVTTHPCRAPCFADRPPQKRNPCPRAVATRTRPSGPPPFCCSNTAKTAFTLVRNTFREITFTAKPTRPRNGQASRRRLACPSANSWVFVGLATGLAVRLNGIGPRPCLTSPGRGSALLDCGDDRSHVAAVERDPRKLPGSTVPEEHGAHRIWERRVQRAGNHRRRADDTNVTGPLAHARVASGGALIERPRRCGPGDRGQPDRRRG